MTASPARSPAPPTSRGLGGPSRSRIRRMKAPKPSAAEITCEKYSEAKIITIVAKPQGDRGGGAVAGLEPVGRPAHPEEEQHRRDHGDDQGQRPDHRRVLLDLGLDPLAALGEVAVVLDRDRPVRGPAGPVAAAGVGGGGPGELGPDGVLERQVERQREPRDPGRLDRVEVAVDPGLVAGLPVPPVDLGLAVGEVRAPARSGRAAPSPSSASSAPRRPRGRRSRRRPDGREAPR